MPQNNDREVPKAMEPGDIAAVVAGFGEAASRRSRGRHGRRRGQRRPVQPGPPVPLGSDQPANAMPSARTAAAFSRRSSTSTRAAVDGGILGLRLSVTRWRPGQASRPSAAAEIVDDRRRQRRLPRGRARLDLLHLGHATRRSHRAGLQPRPGARTCGRWSRTAPCSSPRARSSIPPWPRRRSRRASATRSR